MPLPRNQDGLIAYLERVGAWRFGYAGAGAHHCVGFALGGIKAQGLPRPRRAPAAAAMASPVKAARLLAERGGLVAAVDGVLDRVPSAFAQRGDVACVETPDGPGLGLVEGETIVIPGATGLIRQPRAAILIAWSAQCPTR